MGIWKSSTQDDKKVLTKKQKKLDKNKSKKVKKVVESSDDSDDIETPVIVNKKNTNKV